MGKARIKPSFLLRGVSFYHFFHHHFHTHSHLHHDIMIIITITIIIISTKIHIGCITCAAGSSVHLLPRFFILLVSMNLRRWQNFLLPCFGLVFFLVPLYLSGGVAMLPYTLTGRPLDDIWKYDKLGRLR